MRLCEFERIIDHKYCPKDGLIFRVKWKNIKNTTCNIYTNIINIYLK